MKKVLFTLATVLVGLSHANAENNVTSEVNASAKVNDTAVARPTSVTGDEQILAINEDLKITEASVDVVAPLLPGKSQEEVIADDNLVIEGSVKEVFPLDFKKIEPSNKKLRKSHLKKNRESLLGSL